MRKIVLARSTLIATIRVGSSASPVVGRGRSPTARLAQPQGRHERAEVAEGGDRAGVEAGPSRGRRGGATAGSGRRGAGRGATGRGAGDAVGTRVTCVGVWVTGPFLKPDQSLYRATERRYRAATGAGWLPPVAGGRPVESSTVLLVGLTGGIGAGKSTVAELLTERGAIVIDGDLIARRVVEPGQPALAAIVERFGPEVLAPGRDASIGRRWPPGRSRATRTARRWRRSPIRRSARSSCAR